MKAAIRLFRLSGLLDSNVAASAQQEYDVNPGMPGNHLLDDDACARLRAIRAERVPIHD